MKRNNMMLSTSSGPLLAALIDAQREDEAALSYPRITSLAFALAEHCDDLGQPVVLPVGEAADRLLGATVVISEGEVRPRGWTGDLAGERVLLLSVSAVSPSSLVEAAGHARAMGAIEVHACGVNVTGLDDGARRAGFDSCATIGALVAA
jgi:hypothetical protein